MLLEILAALRGAAVEIVQSTIETNTIVVRYLVEAVRIFATGLKTAHPLEIIAVVLLFLTIGILLAKFLWAESKPLLVFFLIILFLFVLAIMLL